MTGGQCAVADDLAEFVDAVGSTVPAAEIAQVGDDAVGPDDGVALQPPNRLLTPTAWPRLLMAYALLL